MENKEIEFVFHVYHRNTFKFVVVCCSLRCDDLGLISWKSLFKTV